MAIAGALGLAAAGALAGAGGAGGDTGASQPEVSPGVRYELHAGGGGADNTGGAGGINDNNVNGNGDGTSAFGGAGGDASITGATNGGAGQGFPSFPSTGAGGAAGTVAARDGQDGGGGANYNGGGGGGFYGAQDASGTNTSAITGGNGGNGGSGGTNNYAGGGGGAGAYGAVQSVGMTNSSATISGGAGGRGGDSQNQAGGGGGGGSALYMDTSGTITNTGASGTPGVLAGGAGGAGGNGGVGGLAVSSFGPSGGGGGGGGNGVKLLNGTLVNEGFGSITGGAGGAGGANFDAPGIAPDRVGKPGDGGAGGDGVNATASGQTIQNAGSITGGNGGAGGTSVVSGVANGNGGAGGVGARITGDGNTLINAGTITGGTGGAGASGAGTQANAVTITGNNNTLELQSGYAFSGLVQATGSANALRLGGATNASFAVGDIGTAYQGFSAFLKNGTSTWTLTGTTTQSTPWTVSAGALAISADAALGDVAGGLTLAGGALQSTASFATTRALTLGLGGGTINTDSGTTLTWSGAMSGSDLTKDGAGTLVLTGANSTGATTISAGTLQVGDGGTTGTLGSGAVTNNAALVFNRSDAITVANGISGSGSLTQAGAGTVLLSGVNNYSGTTNVNAGVLRAGAANALSAASAHNVAAGATLDLAGLNQSVAGITHAGTISLLGSAPGTVLTVTGPWDGQGGTLAMGTALGDSSSATDRVVLSGASAIATGTSLVAITNLGGLGGQTTGNGIEIVGTSGGGTIQGSVFQLAAPVNAGAYEYRLNNTTTGAYLSSTTTTPITPTDPVTPVDPPPTGVPLYRAEVPLYSALPEQVRQANIGMLATMHQRMGDDGAGTVKNASATQGHRQAWGRIVTVDRDIRQGGTVSPNSEGRLTGFQAGTDLWADPQWRAGVYVGQLDGDMHVSGFARGMQGYAVGRNKLKNQYLGGYVTWRTDSGLYVDGVLQGGRHRSTVGATGSFATESKGSSLLASVEVGQAFAITPNWSVEPQLQLVHQRLSMDDSGLIGAIVQQDAHNGWAVRAGVRVKGEFATGNGTVQPYARLNVWHNGSGSDRTRFIGPAAFTDISTRTGGTSTELAVGANWQVTPVVGVYGELGQLWSSGGSNRVQGGPNASVGVKLRW